MKLSLRSLPKKINKIRKLSFSLINYCLCNLKQMGGVNKFMLWTIEFRVTEITVKVGWGVRCAAMEKNQYGSVDAYAKCRLYRLFHIHIENPLGHEYGCIKCLSKSEKLEKKFSWYWMKNREWAIFSPQLFLLRLQVKLQSNIFTKTCNEITRLPTFDMKLRRFHNKRIYLWQLNRIWQLSEHTYSYICHLPHKRQHAPHHHIDYVNL